MEFTDKVIRHLKAENPIQPVSPQVTLCTSCAAINLVDLCCPAGYPHLPNARDLVISAASCPLCTLFLEDILQTNCTQLAGEDVTQSYSDKLRAKGTYPTDELSLRLHVANGSVRILIFDKIEEKAFEFDSLGLKLFTTRFPSFGRDASANGPTKGFVPQGLIVQKVLDLSVLRVVVDSWTEQCSNKHSICKDDKRKSPLVLPTRILDLGISASCPIKLVNSTQTNGKYAALSHCWGGSQPLKTTTATLDNHCYNIPFDSLPATLKDAVKVTRALGIQYLWIDSIAIIQDDPDDWKKEVEKMGDVFANSTITIAATRAQSSLDGFLGPRAISQAVQICAEPEAVWIGPRHSFARDVDDGHLASRGWILQERVLAPRTVHFTGNGVYWECWSQHQHEDLDALHLGIQKEDMFPSMLAPGSHEVVKQTPRQWLYLLGEYSASNLTYQSDKLAAISGLMRKMSERTGLKQVSGVWEDLLHPGLLWSARADALVQLHGIAPSWSCAGWKGAINHVQLYEYRANERVRFVSDPISGSISLQCDLLTLNPTITFGIVEDSTSSYPPELDYHPARFRAIYDSDSDLCGWITLDTENGNEIDWRSFAWVLVAKAVDKDNDSSGPFYCLLVIRDVFVCGYVRAGVAAIDRMLFTEEETDKWLI